MAMHARVLEAVHELGLHLVLNACVNFRLILADALKEVPHISAEREIAISLK